MTLPRLTLEECRTPVMAPALRDEEAEAIARSLKAVAEPMRIKILHRLASAAPDGVCVCDLVEPLGLTQPTVSHHLKILLDAGLVDRRHPGPFSYYAPRDAEPDPLSQLLPLPSPPAPRR